MSLIKIFDNGIIQSLIAGYCLFILVKLIAFIKIRKFMGDYTHFRDIKEANDKVIFIVSNNWMHLFIPIPNMTIKIIRKDYENLKSHYWRGIFNSDILNPLQFKGNYLIRGDDYGNEKTGWHDVYLFEDIPLKIAFICIISKRLKANKSGFLMMATISIKVKFNSKI